MINPVWLISFVEVVNRSSISAASRHLKITPAAVSKHILSLENALGLELLKRSNRQIEITPEGLLYFEHAKGILEAYQQAEAALSHSREPSGVLKVVCGPEIGNLYVIPYLKEFLELYPKLRLQIDFTQTMPDLEKEKIDVVIGLSTGIPSNWIQRSLHHARWVFCASPQYLKDYGIPKKPADLIKHRIITRTQRQPNNIIKFKTGETVQFDPYLFLNDTRAIRQCVLQGLGIGQLHDYIVKHDLKEKKLVEILSKFTEQEQTLPTHISYPPTANMHVKIRKFIDFIVEKF